MVGRGEVVAKERVKWKEINLKLAWADEFGKMELAKQFCRADTTDQTEVCLPILS